MSTSSKHYLATLALLTTIGAVGCLFSLSFYQVNAINTLFIDDQAFSMQIGKLISEGHLPLTGLPSHLGARHIGPLYLWIMGVVTYLADHDIVLATKILTAFKVAGIGVTALLGILLLRPGTKALSYLLVAFVCLCFFGNLYTWILRVDWANNFILLPSSLALLLTWLAIRHGPSCFLPLAFGYSTLLQTHLSTGPYIVGLGLTVVISWWNRYRSKSVHTSHVLVGKAAQLVSIFGLLALWLPPLWYEIEYSRNLWRLAKVHFGAEPETTAGFSSAAAVINAQFRSIFLDPTTLSDSTAQLIAIAQTTFFALLIIVFLDYLTQARWELRWFWVAVGLSSVTTLFALKGLAPPIHQYYAWCLLPVPPLLISVTLSHATKSLLRDTSRTTISSLFIFRRLLSVSMLSIFFPLVALSAWDSYRSIVKPDLPAVHTLKHAQEVAKIIERERAPGEVPRIFTTGVPEPRSNAIYHHLSENTFPYMMYSRFFREFSFVRDKQGRPKRSTQTTGFLLFCPKQVRSITREIAERRVPTGWEIGAQVSLAECSTCNSCSLFRLTRLTQVHQR